MEGSQPILRTDFNMPLDADGCHIATVDSAWHGIGPDVVVMLSDYEGSTVEGVTVGSSWIGPSGTQYIKVKTSKWSV